MSKFHPYQPFRPKGFDLKSWQSARSQGVFRKLDDFHPRKAMSGLLTLSIVVSQLFGKVVHAVKKRVVTRYKLRTQKSEAQGKEIPNQYKCKKTTRIHHHSKNKRDTLNFEQKAEGNDRNSKDISDSTTNNNYTVISPCPAFRQKEQIRMKKDKKEQNYIRLNSTYEMKNGSKKMKSENLHAITEITDEHNDGGETFLKEKAGKHKRSRNKRGHMLEHDNGVPRGSLTGYHGNNNYVNKKQLTSSISKKSKIRTPLSTLTENNEDS